MQSFEDLYARLTRAAAGNQLEKEVGSIKKEGNYSEYHLECLLHPEKCPDIIRLGKCNCVPGEDAPCEKECIVNAITHDENAGSDR